MLLNIVVAVLVGYLLGNLNGAVSMSVLVGKEDVRSKGSGNAGLTNFIRNYGGTNAIAVVLIDAGKAVISCLAIFIFNTPGRNPLVNIGSGLWDTYNMVTGLLGDVLSYIRLYALGLAGGMLGNAFNIMGTMILDIPIPALNWVFCIVILIFGHVLNLAMSCLGAFVHPLRLTFVEYFKNSGYEGTGKFYSPLTTDKEE